MKVTLWGTRGSLATPGPETARYGGNTASIQVTGADGTQLVLDAGTGIRRLGMSLPPGLKRVDILLTHLHMDHLQGLGFFRPLRTPGVEAHIWGPASTTLNLRKRLSRYLSPPLFPVWLRDLESELYLHEVPRGEFRIGEFHVGCALVCHPDFTVGFRISNSHSSLTYLPDHEPAMGVPDFPLAPDWTSGYSLAADADLLIHDAQYTTEEYEPRIGWGHSSIQDAFAFADLAHVRHLVPFHHDPGHNDADLDLLYANAMTSLEPEFTVTPAQEGMVFEL